MTLDQADQILDREDDLSPPDCGCSKKLKTDRVKEGLCHIEMQPGPSSETTELYHPERRQFS